MSEPTPGQNQPGPAAAEILDSGRTTVSRTRKPLIIGAAGLLGVAVLAGAGTVTAVALSRAGASPAEAFPASTVAYAEIDLTKAKDAVPLLRKLPALERELGLGEGEDPRQALVAQLCEEADFATDVEPWLGYKAAFGAVPATGEPTMMLALQVTDEDDAEKGLARLATCGEQDAAWSVSDGWAVLAQSDDDLEIVANALKEGALSDDAGFTRWTGEVGDAGFVTAYLSDEMPEMIAEAAENGAFDKAADEMIANPFAELGPDAKAGDLAETMRKAMKDFGGAAFTLRASDGAFELEGASTVAEQTTKADAGTIAGTLPKDTTAVVAANPGSGWLQSSMAESGVEDQLTQMLEMAPGDLEKVLGDSFALAVGDLDLTAPDGLQVGLKLEGADAAGVEKSVNELSAGLGAPGMVSVDSEGDLTAVGIGEYGKDLLADGGLGGTEKFKNALPNADDASAVVYVDFDGLDKMVTTMAPGIADDIEALGQLGFSAYADGDTARALARITFD